MKEDAPPSAVQHQETSSLEDDIKQLKRGVAHMLELQAEAAVLQSIIANTSSTSRLAERFVSSDAVKETMAAVISAAAARLVDIQEVVHTPTDEESRGSLYEQLNIRKASLEATIAIKTAELCLRTRLPIINK